MIPTFKAGLLATTMAAVALVPAAGLLTLVSVDAAFAKGEGNGNGGNGNGGGRGNGGHGSEARGGKSEARGGGRPEWAGSNGNRGGGRSETARRGNDPVSNFLRNLTGEQKREARAEARAARRAPTEYAPVASIQPGKRPARNSDMHPSQLGNMNGALNANINAVLAHIRNGNVNGPVGGLAALAVADANLAEAERIVNEGTLSDLLDKYEYDSVQDYYDQLAADPDMERYKDLDEAIAALGSDPELGEPYEFTPPTDGERETAEAALPDLLDAQAAAEGGMLSLWNKNPDTNPDEISPEEDALLEDLRQRLQGYETDIEQAVMDREAGVTSDDPDMDEEAACEGPDACDTPEEGEDLAAVE